MKKSNGAARFLALCLTVVLAAFSLPSSALAAVPERPSNQYVLDQAGVLSDSTESEIISKNQKLFTSTGAQIVVAAVDFLGGDSIDDYVYEMFNTWGVGSKERNNGLLLVLAIGEDNYYAQAGYGIENYFDGAKLQEMLDEKLEPDFAAGDYNAGVQKFFQAALEEMTSYYEGYTDEYTQQEGFNQGGTSEDFEAYGGNDSWRWMFTSLFKLVFRIIFVVLIVVVVLVIVRAISGGGGRGGYGGGGGGGFWTGMFLGNLLGGRRNRWRGPPPPGPGGFGPRPPRSGGFGGFGGFSGGGHSSGGGGFRGGGGGFHGGGGSHGGGAGRR